MNELLIKIKNIKGISAGELELPIENGIIGIVGSNGAGKSTIFSCLSQLISKRNLFLMRPEDMEEGSEVQFSYNGKSMTWRYSNNTWSHSQPNQTIRFNGIYEGSLFYGFRFSDSKKVEELIDSTDNFLKSKLRDADTYIVEHLGKILHQNPNYYSNLSRIQNRHTAKEMGLRGLPYFVRNKGYLISQYRMSSGECMLISLLHFIYNSIVMRSLPENEPILMLIDEIELALHPVAVYNLMGFLEEITKKYGNLTIILSSHSAEVIRKISPNKLFFIERVNDAANNFNVTSPCYPSYAIRDVYKHDGYDYLLLVEDSLAKIFVDSAISQLDLNKSCLINTVPVGGWKNVLELHKNLLNTNTLGLGTTIISILDGDVQVLVNKDYKNFKKLFLPIPSIEKYLLRVLVDEIDVNVKKKLNDKLFQVTSLDDIVKQYNISEDAKKNNSDINYKGDKDGKILYRAILENLKNRSITEDVFIIDFYKVVQASINTTTFQDNLSEIISDDM